ncbi:MAG: hypothetical protein A2Y65_08440 [Deltaproteobacteria bacterium RBG_13_52_11]|nr:MAG: hypothetical protein A2Y65_08440 [Deltaproteobacteria bacterium RBG_13_52_11]
MPCLDSGRGFEAIRYIKPLSMTLYGGRETIENVREIRRDHALTEAIGLEEILSSSAMEDWLRGMGGG